MPSLVCGLDCFALPMPATADSIAREFAASFHPSLPDAAASSIEVYRLEPVPCDATLAAEELVLCRVPNWSFDLAALEALHQQLEDLREQHQELQVQYARAREALIALTSSAEASPTGRTPVAETFGVFSPGVVDCDPAQEVVRLRQKLALSEQNQYETKATVVALRNEFMHLVEMWGCDGLAKQDSEFSLEGRPYGAFANEFVDDYCTDFEKTSRFSSRLPQRQAGSPRSWTSPGASACGHGHGGPGRHGHRHPAPGQAVRARSAGRRTVRSAGAPLGPRRPTT